MRITKIGTKPSERLWKGRCSSCKSEAEASEGELHNITEDQREGRFAWQKCPVCGAGGDKFSGYGGMLFYPADRI